MSDAPDNIAYFGSQDPGTTTSEAGLTEFLVDQIVNRRTHATLVKIQAVTNTPGQLTGVGRVDVLPLVNQVDGHNKAVPHTTAYNLCYFRAQGGKNAIICDPEVGDIGVAVICDRDISSVKANMEQSNPGSGRRSNVADGIFFGVCLANAPEQYVRFLDTGIEIVDKNSNKIQMTSDGIEFNP